MTPELRSSGKAFQAAATLLGISLLVWLAWKGYSMPAVQLAMARLWSFCGM